MKAAALALVGVFGVVMCGVVGVYALAQWARLAAPEHSYSCTDDPKEVNAATVTSPQGEVTVAPLLAGALNTGGQWRVLCASMDGGAPTDLMIPTDGGTAGIRVPAEAIYVAPTEGSSVNVHVGFNATSTGRPSGAISASTGFIVGTTGRDGVGVSLDAKSGSNPACLSSGAAQAVDVIAGRQ